MQIKDIAKLAEVAPSTVSRVINDSGYVSTEVRERVERIIEETGYIPNSIAKSLKAKKTNTIGIVIPQITSESMAKMVEGVTHEAEKRNYQIILTITGLKNENELTCIEALSQRQIDGIILMSMRLTEKHYEVISRLQFPTVVVGQRYDEICSLVQNNVSVSKDVTTKLLSKGYNNIGFININMQDEAIKTDRFLGYKLALDGAGISVNDDFIAYSSDFTIDSGYEAMKQLWNKSEKKFDAVFCVTDKIAIGAMKYLNEINIKIPEECGIIGIGNNKLSEFTNPPLATVDFHNKNIGIKATQILFDSIQNRKKPTETYYQPYEILERESI